MGAMVGTIGAIQATEAIKLITGAGKPAIGKFVIYNSLDMQFRNLKLHKDPTCPICGTNPTIKELIDYEQFCGMKVEDTQTKEVAVGKDEITALELKVMMDEKRDFALIDVREPNEFSLASIEGSVLIPMRQVPGELQTLEGRADEAPLIVFCHHGVRSLNVVNWLRGQGLDACQSMAGGIDAWSLSIDPSVPRY